MRTTEERIKEARDLNREQDLQEEVLRIRRVFAERAKKPISDWLPHYSLYARYIVYERTALLLHVFRKLNVKTLAGFRILDVGCGGGTQLRYLFDFGAQPRNLFGVDVLEDVLHTAKHLSPHVGFCVANAAKLPFCDAAFDLVFQSLVFTSVLDPRIKQAMAAEVLRVLRPGGRFVWYDFMYDNPRNRDVKGITKREIRELLPGCKFQFWRLSLAPPIGRTVAALSPFLFHLLSQFPFLCTHYLCVAEKAVSADACSGVA